MHGLSRYDARSRKIVPGSGCEQSRSRGRAGRGASEGCGGGWRLSTGSTRPWRVHRSGAMVESVKSTTRCHLSHTHRPHPPHRKQKPINQTIAPCQGSGHIRPAKFFAHGRPSAGPHRGMVLSSQVGTLPTHPSFIEGTPPTGPPVHSRGSPLTPRPKHRASRVPPHIRYDASERSPGRVRWGPAQQGRYPPNTSTPGPGCSGTPLTRQTPSAQNRWSLPSVQSPTEFGHGRSPAGGHPQHGPCGRGSGAAVRHARRRHRRTQRCVRRLCP